MSANEEIDKIERYFRKNLMAEDFPTNAIYEALSELATLKQELQTLRDAAPVPASEWQSIETAPKDGTNILVFTKNGMIESYFALGEWCQSICTATYEGEIYFIDEPTRWMPLPSPQKDQS